LNLVKNRLVVFFFLNLFILSDIIFYHSLVNAFVLITFVAYLFFILIFETTILYFVIKKTKLFSIILLTIFTSINFISFKLVNYGFINSQGSFSKLIILFLFIFVFFIISKRVFERKNIIFILISILLISISSGISIFLKEHNYLQNVNPSNFPLIPKFEKKPDIFLLGIDGLIPLSMLEKFYYDYSSLKIKTENFHDIKNSFAPKTPTEFSFKNIMNISQNYPNIKKQAFIGQQNSLLFEIFKKNGYNIHTGFSINFFGSSKGKHIDKYIVYDNSGSYRSSIACLDKSRFLFLPKYLSLCRSNSINRIISNFIYVFFPSQKSKSEFSSETSFLLPHLNKTKNPKLLLYHSLKYTGHTASDYDHSNQNQRQNFSKHYIDKYKKAFLFINETFKYIKNNNPNAIVLFFGDHGSFLYIKDNDKFLNQDQFLLPQERDFLLDRHAIRQLYLKTNNSCISENKYSQIYSTTSREIANIIFCLSSNKEDVQRLFYAFNDKRYSTDEHGHKEVFIDWKDYLYD
jgi:hypothetical protein